VAVTVAPTSTHGTPPDQVSWVISNDGERAVIAVEGKLGLAAAGVFAAALAAVGAGGTRAVVDMSRVETIDAGALDGLVRVRRLFEILGLGLTLRAPSGQIERSLGQFHLEELIEAG